MNITPPHLRCGLGQCPSVHVLEDGRLLIVGEGEITAWNAVNGIGIKLGETERAVVVSPDLLSDLPEHVKLREDIARYVERDTERLEGLERERRLAIRHTALLSIYREALKTISENADCGGPWCAARAGAALSQGKETA